jgi:hypothetical protein
LKGSMQLRERRASFHFSFAESGSKENSFWLGLGRALGWFK